VPSRRRLVEGLQRFQVCSRQATIAPALDFERHFLILRQVLQTRTLNRGDMYEDVFGAVFRRDEAKTLGRIEELNCACLHGFPFNEEHTRPGVGPGSNDDREDQQKPGRGDRATDNRIGR